MCIDPELLLSLKSKLALAAAEQGRNMDITSTPLSGWLTACVRDRDVLSIQELSLCSLIHGSVWVKMHNEFIKGDWRNQERYCLNYWQRARPFRSLWDRQPALSTELTNLIKCTKCYTLTSPLGAIMAPEIERSPPGVFYLLAGDCLCQLADCIDYIDL